MTPGELLTLSVLFLICKMGIIIGSISQSFYEKSDNSVKHWTRAWHTVSVQLACQPGKQEIRGEVLMLDVCGEPSKPCHVEGGMEVTEVQSPNHCCGRWCCLGPGLRLRVLLAPCSPPLTGHLGRQ